MSDLLDNFELRNEEVQDILKKPPHWILKWGNVIYLLIIIILLTLSWFVRYPDLVLSNAIITTQIPPQKLYARTTGNIEVILKDNNSFVNSGEAIAVIENAANYIDVFKLMEICDTITINQNDFSFPINEVPILLLGDLEGPYAKFENNYIQYSLNKKLKPFSNEALANQFSVSELKIRLNNLESQKRFNLRELELKEKELKRNTILFEKGIISEQDLENIQLGFSEAKRNYENIENSISQMREAIIDGQKRLRGTNINKEKEDIVLLKSVVQSFHQLKRDIKNWEQKYVLKSNIEGKMSFLNHWSKNQTVNEGDYVFIIVPNDDSSYVAKLETPAKNYGKIKENQRVNIKLENFPDYEYGVLVGYVKNISSIPNQEGSYMIDVKLEKPLVTSYGINIDFKQEMHGEAQIITEDLRLIERFFYQFKRILAR